MRESSKLAHDGTAAGGTQHSAQILPFPPRQRPAGLRPPGTPGTRPPGTRPPSLAIEPDDDESEPFDKRAECQQDDDDGEDLNDARRMLMNAIAVAVIAILVGVGVWIADTMGALQRGEDCLAQGRKNCTPIEVAPIEIPTAKK